MTGTVFFIVGSSGAGKDALIRFAQDRLTPTGDFVFPRRYVTRDSSAHEDHISVRRDEFHDLRMKGAFCLSWSAHGLEYGIPAEVYGLLQAGKNVVANTSRAMVDECRAVFDRTVVINVTAPKDVLRARLRSRNRESAEEIERRINRADEFALAGRDVVHFINDRSLNAAVRCFTSVLLWKARFAR